MLIDNVWSCARTRLVLFAPVVVLAFLGTAWGQPHAINPVDTPLFSVDAGSPESDWLTAGDVVSKPGPTVIQLGLGLGLIDLADDLDALSSDRSEIVHGANFMLLFGVDRDTQGLFPPDPYYAALGRRFNVTDQAQRNQQAGDMYMSMIEYTRTSTLPAGTPRGGGNNLLAINQGDTGGVDKDLSPEKAPIVTAKSSVKPKSNSNATTYLSATSSTRSPDGDQDEIGPLFFSLSSSSPSLELLPGTTSGADVFYDSNPLENGTEELYAAPRALGLQDGPGLDDIDALVVFDNGDGVLDPAVDLIIFSLAPNSATLDLQGLSPADILVSNGAGVFSVMSSAASIGLLPSDNVDCLSVVRTTNFMADLHDRAIFVVWPGDYDQSGDLTESDCGAFPLCYSGPDVPYDDNGWAVHTVDVGPNAFFSPTDIVIEVGDRVRWVWQGGLHSVVSGDFGTPDGAFDSGVPTSDVGHIFEVVFDEAFLNANPMPFSEYWYYCGVDSGLGMSGTVRVTPHPCATFDVDFDGDVDCEDWAWFLSVYIEEHGTACGMLTIPEFIAALLGDSIDPALACMADVNADGVVDGQDIQPYVEMFLMP